MMDSHKQDSGNGEDATLQRSIVRWRWGIMGAGFLLISAYCLFFFVYLGHPASDNPDKWGSFGDFVGGLLNPVVAFAAFFWVTQSVKLQKMELVATRRELKAAADAQAALVQSGLVAAQLSALSALAAISHDKIAQSREVIEAIARDRPPDGGSIIQQREYDASHKVTLAHLGASVRSNYEEQDRCSERIKQLLEQLNGQSISIPVAPE